MADKFVITEKASQAKAVRPALGARFGFILPARGRLLDLVEPEEAVPAWKRRAILLRREGQLIGQQILEHYRYRGRVMPVLFTAQDPRAARDPSPLAGEGWGGGLPRATRLEAKAEYYSPARCSGLSVLRGGL